MIKVILIIHDSMAMFKIGVVSVYVWSEWENRTQNFYRDRKWAEPGRDRRWASPAANSGIWASSGLRFWKFGALGRARDPAVFQEYIQVAKHFLSQYNDITAANRAETRRARPGADPWNRDSKFDCRLRNSDFIGQESRSVPKRSSCLLTVIPYWWLLPNVQIENFMGSIIWHKIIHTIKSER